MPTTTVLSLRAVMVIKGFDRPQDLVNASGAPQPVVSGMLRGNPGYPKAQEQVAAALGLSRARLLAHIAESGQQQAARAATTPTRRTRR
jgi:hypothetical protein